MMESPALPAPGIGRSSAIGSVSYVHPPLTSCLCMEWYEGVLTLTDRVRQVTVGTWLVPESAEREVPHVGCDSCLKYWADHIWERVVTVAAKRRPH